VRRFKRHHALNNQPNTQVTTMALALTAGFVRL
jgi:hypothetical protein